MNGLPCLPISLARYNVCGFRISCSGYFHVGANTSTHLYISLQLKGWNMESTGVRKKIPDLHMLMFNFRVPVFQCQGRKP